MLLRKVLRDLRQNATQFVAIFIMTFFAMFFVGAFDSAKTGMQVSGTNYLEEFNFKDIDIQGSIFGNSHISALESMDDVENVDGIMHASGRIILDKEYLLVMSFISSNDVSKMLVVEGEEYYPGASGVWLEEQFATPNDVQVGDLITLKIGDVTFKEEVKGIVYYPEYIYYLPNDSYPEPIYGTHAFAVMDISKAPFEDKYYDQLIVDLKDAHGQLLSLTDSDNKEMKEAKEKIIKKLDDKEIIVKTKDEDEAYGYFSTNTEAFDAVGTLFATLFIAVAVLGIITTMTRLTSKQRIQIGTMKALGFSKSAIIYHYLSYSTIVTFMGAFLGIMVGKYTLGAYLKSINDYYYQNPYYELKSSMQSIIMPTIAVVMSIITTYYCTRKTLTENAANILKPETPKTGHTGFFEKTKFWERLKFGIRWNIRDVDRNKLRTAMSVLGIVFTTTLLFAAFGFYECIAGQSSWMYGELCNAGYRILFEDVSYGVVYDYAKEYSGQMVQFSMATIDAGKVDDVRPMIVVDEGNLYRFMNEDLEYFDLPSNGVILTHCMEDNLEVSVGDTITWRIPGDPNTYEAKVMGFCRQATDEGMIISRKAWENLHGEFRPNMLYTNKSVDSSLSKRPEVSAVNDNAMMRRTLESSNEMGYAIAFILITIAVIMGVIVLYNLGELSYIEKVREIATMKVLGFQSLDIRMILLQQNLSVTILGAIIGVPFGRMMLSLVNYVFFEPDGEVIVRLSPLVLIMSVIGTFAVSVVVNIYITSKVNDIDMVEALKGVE